MLKLTLEVNILFKNLYLIFFKINLIFIKLKDLETHFSTTAKIKKSLEGNEIAE